MKIEAFFAVMFQSLLAATMSVALADTVSSSQGPQEDTSTPSPCVAFNEDGVGRTHLFEASPKVRQLVDEIIRIHGLSEQRVDVYAANVENATAVLCESEQRILYNPRLFHDIDQDSGWPARVILAHELGHLLNNHPRIEGEERVALELEADEFAGSTICQLGGDLNTAESVFETLGVGTGPSYPELSGRLAAVAAGWTRALGRGACPDSARLGLPSDLRLFPNLEGVMVVTAETAPSLQQRSVLAARRIHFQAIDFEVDHPLLLVAEVITFDPVSRISGPKLSFIAQTMEGGTVDVSGEPGQSGGEVMVAAVRLAGSSLLAHGGEGTRGRNGDPGTDGKQGARGVDGRCGPGITGDFRGSRAGGDGQPGSSGHPGGPGGNGGDGGQIALLTYERIAVFTALDGGRGGQGGDGGPAGRGGRGGRGGSGCSGIGGHQPDRPNGADGLDGHPGSRGNDGNGGLPGQIWSRPLAGAAELRSYLGHAKTMDQREMLEAAQQLELLLTTPVRPDDAATR